MAGVSAEQMRGGGTPIVLAAGAAGLVLAALCLALAGTGEQGTVAGLRATAVLAVPFLVGAYAAPALAVLWPGDLSEWLLLRRRSLWLAFFAVIAVHLVLIVRLLSLPANPPPTVLGLTPGFMTYMVMAGMVLTSLSRVARGMGPARVRLLHRVGEHWVFAVVTLGLLKGVFIRHSPLYLVPLMMVMAAYAMRFEAWRRAERAQKHISR
jgi:hypothetical protein